MPCLPWCRGEFLKGIGLSRLFGHIKLTQAGRPNNIPYSNTVGQVMEKYVSEHSLLIFSREKFKS